MAVAGTATGSVANRPVCPDFRALPGGTDASTRPERKAVPMPPDGMPYAGTGVSDAGHSPGPCRGPLRLRPAAAATGPGTPRAAGTATGPRGVPPRRTGGGA